MELTDKDIQDGFWYFQKKENFPPKSITEFEEYKPSECLNLVITQLPMGGYQQKKIIEKWIAELPKLEEVKYLWFRSRVNQQMFDAACQMPNLEGLYVKWSGIKDISKINMLKNLIHLHLGSSAQIQSIDCLQENKNLVTLELENLKKIRDFSVLSKLSGLEGLSLDGDMYSTQVIETLAPIGKLTNLKYFTMRNSRLIDKSFDPLLNLQKLIRFCSSWNYPDEEFLKLKALPKFQYGNTEQALADFKNEMAKQ